MGEVSPLLHRLDSGAEVQPAAHAGHPARPTADCENRQRDRHLAQRCAQGLCRFRFRRRQKVRYRSERTAEEDGLKDNPRTGEARSRKRDSPMFASRLTTLGKLRTHREAYPASAKTNFVTTP